MYLRGIFERDVIPFHFPLKRKKKGKGSGKEELSNMKRIGFKEKRSECRKKGTDFPREKKKGGEERSEGLSARNLKSLGREEPNVDDLCRKCHRGGNAEVLPHK